VRLRNLLLILKLIRESYIFALNAIIVNKLRTLLSLLGITIGIFAIITVFTIFDSMESSIRTSINSLGNNVLFVQKWPWSMSNNYPWWKYWRRPEPRIHELREIQRKSITADAATYMFGFNRTVKYRNNAIENADIIGITYDYDKVMSVEIADGRYFTQIDDVSGRAIAIIGAQVAENLFQNENPIGKRIKIFGLKTEVVGVLKKEGESPFGNNADNQVLMPVNYLRNIMNLDYDEIGATIAVKAKPNISNDELRDELTGIMRSARKLKPGAEDNFAINETSLISEGFDALFSIIATVGWIIGGFSLLVGGFGIANIMFVSVKERTPIIGIQKSLGAKNYFVLLEFLFESVFLALFGGIIGLALVFGGTLIISNAWDMDITLTWGNIMLGITVSFVIGLVSGVVPAYTASRLDPVVAIRSV
jgi:putative ABC transport system permease protein